MKKLKMYCLWLHNKHFQTVKKLGYIPVGLGKGFFSPEWLRDNEGENISNKNEFYGEYTFHYWFWKNYLDKLEDGWIGFCQYRKFWSLENHKTGDIKFNTLGSQSRLQPTQPFWFVWCLKCSKRVNTPSRLPPMAGAPPKNQEKSEYFRGV